jgi:hypothetical protein
MLAKQILQEASHGKCSFDAMVAQHAPIRETLPSLSGRIRGSAGLLQVLVALKIGPAWGWNRQVNDVHIT